MKKWRIHSIHLYVCVDVQIRGDKYQDRNTVTNEEGDWLGLKDTAKASLIKIGLRLLLPFKNAVCIKFIDTKKKVKI